jgi:3-oxoacyl-[acyl-carrier-protein] synthase II
VRRVAVTGVGTISPLGLDAPSTWRTAVAGESGIDWIKAFDASDFPVRVAAEVKDFDATEVASAKEARKLERNVLLALGAAREAMTDANMNGFDPHRVGIIFGSAIGGLPGIVEQADVLIVSLTSPGVFEQLRGLVRRDHTIIDLARIPDAASWPCAVEGLCW